MTEKQVPDFSIGEHYDSWADVVLQSIARSKRRIVENGIFEEAYCDNVMAILERFDPSNDSMTTYHQLDAFLFLTISQQKMLWYPLNVHKDNTYFKA